MLSEQDFAAWAKRMGLTDEALSVVAHVRCSQPARRVGGGHSNVTGRYPSKKMGVTIQFESHRVELPTVYELEHDDGVLEYWDQPLPSSWTTGCRWKATGCAPYAGLLRHSRGRGGMGRVQDRRRADPAVGAQPKPILPRRPGMDLPARP